MNHIFALLTVVAAYLIGSINFAVIFTRKYNNVDVRDFGSGNAGTTNVLRVSGVKAGIATFALDILKGAVAAGIGFLVFNLLWNDCNVGMTATSYRNPLFLPQYGAFASGFACMLGHCFPVFFGFRGGKAVATSVGVFAVCCPLAIILGLVGFAISMLLSKIVSLSSLFATFVVVGVTAYLAFSYKISLNANPWVITIITIGCGLIVILRHLENIKRLIKGEEKKISVKKENKNG